jgi:hypothetical protein
MKKLLFTSIILFIYSSSKAQGSLDFGLKGGFNFANIKTDNTIQDNKSILGIQFGGFLEYKISEKFGLQPELLLSTQGTTTTFENSSSNSKVNLTYLNLPIMAKYYLTDKINFEAGPQIGFLLLAKQEINSTSSYYDSNNNLITWNSNYVDKSKHQFNTIDLGFNLGANYKVTKDLAANLRYSIGLTNINNPSYTDHIDKNRVLSLAICYKLPNINLY